MRQIGNNKGASSVCDTCSANQSAVLKKKGGDVDNANYTIALIGNPNTGKSTIFNALTGLRQHTGNWPGKTVARAEGGFNYRDKSFRIIDLPGLYSLLSASEDEQIARDFLLFGRPDATLVVVDASRLERTLLLAVQVMEITPRVVVCVNLIDEAEKTGIKIDARALARELGAPVALTDARSKIGLENLLAAAYDAASGAVTPAPKIKIALPAELEAALSDLENSVRLRFPSLPNARWIARRLLEGDAAIEAALSAALTETMQNPDSVNNALSMQARMT